jgi:hypothetical protein
VRSAWTVRLKMEDNRVRTAKRRQGLKTTVQALLNAGVDVHIDCPPLARSRSTFAPLAYLVGELEVVFAAGAILDTTSRATNRS